MCGICGTKGFSLESFEQVRPLMVGALTHRGPDESREYVDRAHDVFLGATRLSIVDLTTGSQPIFNEDRSIALVCNGEIYNSPVLREVLCAKGHRFSSQTDTEVIVHLYEEEGIAGLSRLKGMFAFALWDKAQEKLLLVRDRLGIKPLYYYSSQNGIAFASEIKSLLCLPFVPRDIDLEATDLYFSLEYVPAPLSIYASVQKLRPGTYILCDCNGIKEKSFWDIGSCPQTHSPVGRVEAEERLRELLQRSVQEHLLSDVPVGVFLSGGLDSSLLSALAMRQIRRGCCSFSIGFDEKSFDETPYARKVAGLLGTEHYHRIFTLGDFLAAFSRMTHHLDEPLGDFSVFPTYFLSCLAREHVKTVLSGEGGDELFLGYPTYWAHRFCQGLPGPVLNGFRGALQGIAAALPVNEAYFSLGFKTRQFLRSDGHRDDAVCRHASWMGAFLSIEKDALYSPGLRERCPGNTLQKHLSKLLERVQTGAKTLKGVQYFDMYGYLSDGLLVKADRASMAASLEVRVPYLDHELMEFVWGLPQDFVFQKRLLKKVAESYLPADILRRKKQGFSIPLTSWLKNKKFLALVGDFFSRDFLRQQGLFDHQYVSRMLAEHVASKKDYRKQLGTYIMFQAWYRSQHMATQDAV